MNPLSTSLRDVIDEFNVWRAQGNTGTSLEDFAQQQDANEGTTRRQSAYKVSTMQRINDFLGRASSTVASVPIIPTTTAPESLDKLGAQLAQWLPTGVLSPEREAAMLALRQQPAAVSTLPGLMGAGMAQVAPLVGYPELSEDFRKIGETTGYDVPRLAATTLPIMKVGQAAAAAGRAVTMGESIASLAPGMMDSFLRSKSAALETGGENPNLQGFVSAGTFAAMPTAGRLGRVPVAAALSRLPSSGLGQFAERAAETVGGMAGMAAAGQAGTTAEQITGGRPVGEAMGEILTPLNLVAQAASQVPFAPMAVHETLFPRQVPYTPLRAGNKVNMTMPTLSEAYRFQRAAEAQTNADNARQAQYEFHTAFNGQGVKFSILSLPNEKGIRELDLTGAKVIEPDTAVHAILDGDMVPASSADPRTIEVYTQLREGLLVNGVRSFTRERKLLDLGMQVRNAGGESNIDDAVQAQWRSLSQSDRNVASLMAQIYVDPAKTLQLGRLQTQQGTFTANWQMVSKTTAQRALEQINRGAKQIEVAHEGPIENPLQLGSFMRDVNSYVDAINTFLADYGLSYEHVYKFTKENELSSETLQQPYSEQPLTKFTEKEIRDIYERELSGALLDPQGEALSHVIEKAHSAVKEAQLRAQGRLAAAEKLGPLVTRTGGIVAGLEDDKVLVKMLEGLPGPLRDLIGVHYNRHSEGATDPTGNQISSLEPFRDAVMQAVENLTPEQRAKVDALKDNGFLPGEYQALLRRRSVSARTPEEEEVAAAKKAGATSVREVEQENARKEAELAALESERRGEILGKGQAAADETQDLTRTPSQLEKVRFEEADRLRGREDLERDFDEEAADVGEVAMTDAEATRLKQLQELHDAYRDDLEKIPVRYSKAAWEPSEGGKLTKQRGEETVQSNLWDVITSKTRHKAKQVRKETKRLQTQEGLSAEGEEMSSTSLTEGVTPAPTPEELSPADRAEQVKQDAAKAQARKDAASQVIGEFFDTRGPTFDPVERLKTITNPELLTLFSSVADQFKAQGTQQKVSSRLGKLVTALQRNKSLYLEGAQDAREATANFLRDALTAYYLDENRPMATREQEGPTDLQKQVVAKYYGGRYEDVYKSGSQDWTRIMLRVFGNVTGGQRQSLGREASKVVAETQTAVMKAMLQGYDLKSGTSLDEVGAKVTEAFEKLKPQHPAPFSNAMTFEQDLKTSLRQAALQAGLSVQWADLAVPSMTRQMQVFAAVQHPSFVELMNPKQKLGEAMNQLGGAMNQPRVLGLAIPEGTIIRGEYVKSPIIGLDFKEIFDKFGYEDVARYMMTMTAAHEGLHLLVAGPVKHPEGHRGEDGVLRPWAFHEKAQAKQYTNLVDRISQMSDEQKQYMLQQTIDFMVPTQRTREQLTPGVSTFKPEWQAYMGAALKGDAEEFAAVLYSHAIAGLGREMVTKKDAGAVVKPMQERMLWIDDDVRDFFRGQFRNLADMTTTMQRVMDDPNFRHGYAQVTKDKLAVARPAARMTGREAEVAADLRMDTGPAARGEKPVYPPMVEKKEGYVAPVSPTATERLEGATTIAGRQIEQRRINAEELVKSAQQIYLLGSDAQKMFLDLSRLNEQLVRINYTFERYNSLVNRGLLDEVAQPGGLKPLDLGDYFKSIPESEQKLSALQAAPLTPQATQAVQSAVGFFNGEKLLSAAERESFLMRYGASMTQRLLFKNEATGKAVYRDAMETMNWAVASRRFLDGVNAVVQGGMSEKAYKKFFDWALKKPETPEEFTMRKAISKVCLDLNTAETTDARLDSDFAAKSMEKNFAGLTPDQAASARDYLLRQSAGTRRMLEASYMLHKTMASDRIGYVASRMNPGKLTWSDMRVYGKLIQSAAEYAMDPKYKALQVQAEAALNDFVVKKQLDPATLINSVKLAETQQEGLTRMQKKLDENRFWAPEQRYGRYMVVWKDKDAMVNYRKHLDPNAVAASGQPLAPQEEPRSSTFATDDQVSAEYFKRDQEKAGHERVKVIDTNTWSNEARAMQGFEGMDEVASAIERNFAKFLTHVQGITTASNPLLGTQLAQELKSNYNPATAIGEVSVTGTIAKNWMERKYRPGRELLDFPQQFEQYKERTSQALGRASAKSDLMLQTEEMRNSEDPRMADDLRQHFEEITTPESKFAVHTRALVCGNSLVLNFGNMLAEYFAPIQTGLWVLAREVGTKDASLAFGRAFGLLTRNALRGGHFDRLADEFERGVKGSKTFQTASGQQTWEVDSMDKQRELAHVMREMQRLGVVSGGNPMTEEWGQVVQNANVMRPRMGKLDWVDKVKVMTDSALNTILWATHRMSWFREWATSNVQKASALAALEVGYEKGLRGSELRTYGISMVPVMSAIGGRFVRPLAATKIAQHNELTRNTFGSFYTMMNWQVFITTQMAKNLSDSVGLSTMSPMQRKYARQAAVGGLVSNVALAGALGLPMVGAMMAGIQKATGEDPEVLARKALTFTGDKVGELLGSDDEWGRAFSDMAMSGAVNHWTGVDVASKAGVNSLFGFNADTGFSMPDMFGPTAGLLSNVGAAAELATQGEFGKAAVKVAPSGFRPAARIGASLYNYGDLRILDSNDKLLAKPEGIQLMGYALGMQPAGVAQMRRESVLVHRGEQYAQKMRFFEQESLAREVLRGNYQPVLAKAYERMYDNDFDSREFIEGVVNRAVGMETPRDATQYGSLATSQERATLGRTFNAPQASEFARRQKRDELVAAMGYPLGMKPSGIREYTRASLMDQLMQQRGVTRQEASQMLAKQFGI